MLKCMWVCKYSIKPLEQRLVFSLLDQSAVDKITYSRELRSKTQSKSNEYLYVRSVLFNTLQIRNLNSAVLLSTW